MKKESFVQKDVRVVGIRIKSIRKVGKEDVYCLAALRNGTMIANGIITKNCDALRYCVFTHKISKYNNQDPQFGKTLGFRK